MSTPIETQELFDAVRSGDCARVKVFIRQGADVNARDFGGDSALMCAVEAGNTDIVQQLLQAGADVRYEVNDSSALILAELSGQTEIADLLRKAGCSD